MTQLLSPEEKLSPNTLPKLRNYLPMYYNLKKGRMHVFIAHAGEIAIKAVGRTADILTVIGQIIFYIYPREDLTKD